VSQTRSEVPRRVDGVTGRASQRETDSPNQPSNQVWTRPGAQLPTPGQDAAAPVKGKGKQKGAKLKEG